MMSASNPWAGARTLDAASPGLRALAIKFVVVVLAEFALDLYLAQDLARVQRFGASYSTGGIHMAKLTRRYDTD